jgi:hypothetical protein
VTLNRVESVGNKGEGVSLEGNGVVAGTMRDSVIGANGTGVFAASGQVFFTVEESSIVDNLVYGIQTSSAGSAVKVGSSTIGGNGTGVLASSGSIVSLQQPDQRQRKRRKLHQHQGAEIGQYLPNRSSGGLFI